MYVIKHLPTFYQNITTIDKIKIDFLSYCYCLLCIDVNNYLSFNYDMKVNPDIVLFIFNLLECNVRKFFKNFPKELLKCDWFKIRLCYFSYKNIRLIPLEFQTDIFLFFYVHRWRNITYKRNKVFLSGKIFNTILLPAEEDVKTNKLIYRLDKSVFKKDYKVEINTKYNIFYSGNLRNVICLQGNIVKDENEKSDLFIDIVNHNICKEVDINNKNEEDIISIIYFIINTYSVKPLPCHLFEFLIRMTYKDDNFIKKVLQNVPKFFKFLSEEKKELHFDNLIINRKDLFEYYEMLPEDSKKNYYYIMNFINNYEIDIMAVLLSAHSFSNFLEYPEHIKKFINYTINFDEYQTYNFINRFVGLNPIYFQVYLYDFIFPRFEKYLYKKYRHLRSWKPAKTCVEFFNLVGVYYYPINYFSSKDNFTNIELSNYILSNYEITNN